MARSFEKTIFKKGSKTFYHSARFFPKRLRRDVFRLYSFVRIADDYVDEEPTQPEKLNEIEKLFKEAVKYEHFDPTTHAWDDLQNKVVKNMVRLVQRYKFDPAWVEDFLAAMKQDIKPVVMPKLEDSLKYVHGSAEVIGLMMAKMMKLPEETWEAAKLQGRALQWINQLRDLKEDTAKGRQYFPTEDLKAAGLADLSEETARANPAAFKKFVDIQLKRYRRWQQEAAKSFDDIPRRFRIPLQVAVEMYAWTADKIEEDPYVIFKKKLKPRKSRILLRGIKKKLKRK